MHRKDALASGARLLDFHRQGDRLGVDAHVAAVGVAYDLHGVPCEIGAHVGQGDQHPLHLQAGVNLLLHLRHGVEQLRHADNRQVFRLHGHNDGIGGGQGVDRNHAQGGRAVQHDEVVVGPQLIHQALDHGFTAHDVHHAQLQAGQLNAGGQQVNALGMVQDSLAGVTGLALHLVHKQGGEGDGQLVRLLPAKRNGLAGLAVAVHN